MTKIINFNEYKNRRNRVEDTQIARNYILSLDAESLEVAIADAVINSVDDCERMNVKLNFTQIAREQNTTVYKVKKAYKNLIDNKALIEVAKEPGRPVLVSSKNLIIALNFTEYMEILL